MIPDFPYNIRIRLAWLKIFCCCLSLAETANRAETEQRQDATKKIIEPILFLYYEESLLSSNLNSKLLRFHCAHPTIHTQCSQWPHYIPLVFMNFSIERAVPVSKSWFTLYIHSKYDSIKTKFVYLLHMFNF